MSSTKLMRTQRWQGYLDEGCYLLIINLSKIPPHIGFINNKKYYSHSVNGVKSEFSALPILSKLNKKSFNSSLYELTDLNLDDKKTADYFNRFDALGHGGSCLNPIKQVLKTEIREVEHCEFLFDLVGFLQKLLPNSRHHILGDSLSDLNQLELPHYTQQDIDLSIANASELC